MHPLFDVRVSKVAGLLSTCPPDLDAAISSLTNLGLQTFPTVEAGEARSSVNLSCLSLLFIFNHLAGRG